MSIPRHKPVQNSPSLPGTVLSSDRSIEVMHLFLVQNQAVHQILASLLGLHRFLAWSSPFFCGKQTHQAGHSSRPSRYGTVFNNFAPDQLTDTFHKTLDSLRSQNFGPLGTTDDLDASWQVGSTTARRTHARMHAARIQGGPAGQRDKGIDSPAMCTPHTTHRTPHTRPR